MRKKLTQGEQNKNKEKFGKYYKSHGNAMETHTNIHSNKQDNKFKHMVLYREPTQTNVRRHTTIIKR